MIFRLGAQDFFRGLGPKTKYQAILTLCFGKAASTLFDPRAAVARFQTISCLDEIGGAIPGDIRQLMVELLLTGAPTLAKTG